MVYLGTLHSYEKLFSWLRTESFADLEKIFTSCKESFDSLSSPKNVSGFPFSTTLIVIS